MAASARLSSCLIVRGLGIVHVAAFLSLWVQVHGLVGSQGILPVAQRLEAIARAWDAGGGLWRRMPTLLWLDASDAMLHALCGAGVLAGLLLALGVAPAPLLHVSWVAYLSLCTGCSPFLDFQWDSLLLEATLLAVLVAPWGKAVSLARWPQPSRWGTWAMRWLILRLMVLSGAVKLLSGDPAWRDLSAMELHFWTQPLPNPVGWLWHHAPGVLHRGETLLTFAVELGLPLLALVPGRPRRIAFWGFVGLQAGIAATGNYGFFNLLTAILALSLLDDADYPARLRVLLRESAPPARRWPGALVAAAAIGSLALTLVASLDRAGLQRTVGALQPVASAAEAAEPFRSFNAYGLFAVMTKQRREIVLEGSDDGVTWREYRLKWQPGPLDRAPPIAFLHMPRVDWQMWFAALGRWEGPREAWLRAFCVRVLQGSPSAGRFLDHDPFDGRPPRLLRTVSWDYRFTTPRELRETGNWWTRSDRRAYGPTLRRPDP